MSIFLHSRVWLYQEYNQGIPQDSRKGLPPGIPQESCKEFSQWISLRFLQVIVLRVPQGIPLRLPQDSLTGSQDPTKGVPQLSPKNSINSPTEFPKIPQITETVPSRDSLKIPSKEFQFPNLISPRMPWDSLRNPPRFHWEIPPSNSLKFPLESTERFTQNSLKGFSQDYVKGFPWFLQWIPRRVHRKIPPRDFLRFPQYSHKDFIYLFILQDISPSDSPKIPPRNTPKSPPRDFLKVPPGFPKDSPKNSPMFPRGIPPLIHPQDSPKIPLSNSTNDSPKFPMWHSMWHTSHKIPKRGSNQGIP